MSKAQVEILEASRAEEIAFIKALRTLGAGMELKDAKSLAEFIVSSSPCILMCGVDQAVAEKAVALLAEVGVKAVMQDSPVSHPLFLTPKANAVYHYDWKGALKPE